MWLESDPALAWVRGGRWWVEEGVGTGGKASPASGTAKAGWECSVRVCVCLCVCVGGGALKLSVYLEIHLVEGTCWKKKNEKFLI